MFRQAQHLCQQKNVNIVNSSKYYFKVNIISIHSSYWSQVRMLKTIHAHQKICAKMYIVSSGLISQSIRTANRILMDHSCVCTFAVRIDCEIKPVHQFLSLYLCNCTQTCAIIVQCFDASIAISHFNISTCLDTLHYSLYTHNVPSEPWLLSFVIMLPCTILCRYIM